jgi:hypothetical protein
MTGWVLNWKSVESRLPGKDELLEGQVLAWSIQEGIQDSANHPEIREEGECLGMTTHA